MKSTKAQIQLRVADLVQFRLDGAEFWHICEYVREKERTPGSIWYRAESTKPLSDATLWRYIGMADDQIAASCRSSRKKLLRRHLARRRNLFAKANAVGDTRTALAILDSEAKLLGLFPAAGVEVTGKNGAPLQITTVEMTDDERAAAIAAIIARVGQANAGSRPSESTSAP